MWCCVCCRSANGGDDLRESELSVVGKKKAVLVDGPAFDALIQSWETAITEYTEVSLC
jgi:hypothetical protein